jgi:hypothetical protein
VHFTLWLVEDASVALVSLYQQCRLVDTGRSAQRLEAASLKAKPTPRQGSYQHLHQNQVWKQKKLDDEDFFSG